MGDGIEVTTQDAPQAQEKIDVRFKQVENGVHNYTSENVEGYRVFRNEDKKSWTAEGPEGVLKADCRSRSEAQRTVNNKVNGVTESTSPDGASSGEDKPVSSTMSTKEYAVISTIFGKSDPVSIDQILEITEFDRATVMSQLASLSRRKLITLEAEGSKITQKGETAYNGYVPRAPREKAPKAPADPEARRKAMEKKYGARPEGLGPAPTMVEIHEQRLRVVDEQVKLQELDNRLHPYSAIAKNKTAAVAKRREAVLEDLEEARKAEAAAASGQNGGAPAEAQTITSQDVGTVEAAGVL